MKSRGDRLDLKFEVNLANDGIKTSVQFCNLLTRRTLVSVYMRNNTGSCDKQMVSLSKSDELLCSLNCSVIGLSKDTAGSHLKYAEKHSIGFPLVADPEHLFAKATDSLIEKRMYGRTFFGPTRSAYLIDENCCLLGICEKVDPAAHGEQVLALLKAC